MQNEAPMQSSQRGFDAEVDQEIVICLKSMDMHEPGKHGTLDGFHESPFKRFDMSTNIRSTSRKIECDFCNAPGSEVGVL